MEFLKDMLGFLVTRKKLWLLPAIIVLMVVVFFVAVSSGSAIAPFIYTLF